MIPPLSSDPPQGELTLADERDVVRGRQLVRRLAQSQGFSLVEQTKIVTAASELARNAVIYGGGGTMGWDCLEEGERRGLRLVFADGGPGIADVEQAMTDGWSSGSGLGMGLSGARRLVQEFELCTQPGAGTRVTIVRWR